MHSSEPMAHRQNTAMPENTGTPAHRPLTDDIMETCNELIRIYDVMYLHHVFLTS